MANRIMDAAIAAYRARRRAASRGAVEPSSEVDDLHETIRVLRARAEAAELRVAQLEMERRR